MANFKSIIEQVDSFPYHKGSNGLFTLIAHDGVTSLGYVTQIVAQMFDKEDGTVVDFEELKITIDPLLDTEAKRTQRFKEIAQDWKQLNIFEADLKHGWRDELYTIFNPSHCPYMLVERAFSVLIGVITYGVHINGYIPADRSVDGKVKFWIPRRSATKQTYPGMLDNTVAGGLGYPHGLFDTVIKECQEEAGLPSEFVKKSIKSAGVLLYMYYPPTPVNGIERVQPEVEYIYDLPFGDETSIIPQPEDGEAEDFQLLDIDEVMSQLRAGQFKPNCGMVIVDFLLRHGLIDPESEPDYLEIQSRCHRLLPFPTL